MVGGKLQDLFFGWADVSIESPFRIPRRRVFQRDIYFSLSQHRSVALAAVEITNFVVKPGEKPLLPGRSEAHRHETLLQEEHSYYRDLVRESPVAPAPPISVREFAVSYSVSPPPSAYVSQRGWSVSNSSRGSQWSDASPRSISSGQHVLHADKSKNASGIGLAEPSKLPPKSTFPGMPVQPSMAPLAARGPGAKISLDNHPHSSQTGIDGPFFSPPSMTSRTSTNSNNSSAQGKVANDGNGLGFLFTVWSHHPQHTPTPYSVHI